MLRLVVSVSGAAKVHWPCLRAAVPHPGAGAAAAGASTQQPFQAAQMHHFRPVGKLHQSGHDAGAAVGTRERQVALGGVRTAGQVNGGGGQGNSEEWRKKRAAQARASFGNSDAASAPARAKHFDDGDGDEGDGTNGDHASDPDSKHGHDSVGDGGEEKEEDDLDDYFKSRKDKVRML